MVGGVSLTGFESPRPKAPYHGRDTHSYDATPQAKRYAGPSSPLRENVLSQAKADLSHVSAAITIFEGVGDKAEDRPYVDIHRVFAHRELIDLAKRALAESGPLDTRQIARYIMAAKGMDPNDKVLAKADCSTDDLIHSGTSAD